MPRWTDDLKVGALALAVISLLVFAWRWSYDRVRPDEASYALVLDVPDADGVWPGTPVKVAGVEVGAVESIEVVGGLARLDLRVRAAHALPYDSRAELRSSGFLGDRFVAVTPGSGPRRLQDGDRLEARAPPPGLDDLTRDLGTLAADLTVVSGVLREVAESGVLQAQVEATVEHLEALTGEVRGLTTRNADDIEAIVASVRRLSEVLEATAVEARGGVSEELTRVARATETLQAVLDDVKTVTGDVEAGEGTVGALLRDSTTVDLLDETLAQARDVVEGFTGLHAEVRYVGRYFLGTRPQGAVQLLDNPLHGTGMNTLGVRLRSHSDFGYLFEVVDHPLGSVTWEETFVPSLGETYREYRVEPALRFTFQIERRWGPAAFRLGFKESGGGVGSTLFLARDRVQLLADLFDFELGSYPEVGTGLPNLRLGLRVEPLPKVFVEVGAEQVLLGLRYRYFSGYGGVGFHFDDDDIKLLLATLPLPL